MQHLIREYDLEGGHCLQFICEPTGGLQYKLVLIAQRWNAHVRFVDSAKLIFQPKDSSPSQAPAWDKDNNT
jgi:hypothetical protein